MIDISEIWAKYKKLPDDKLIQLWIEKSTLREDVVPILKQEISNRGLLDKITEIDNAESDRVNYELLSLKELQQMVSERLQTGESIESIKVDLADHGVNINELFNQESDSNEYIYDVISSSKEAGIDDALINQRLQKEFNINEDEVNDLKSQMKSRADVYSTIGIGLIIFAILMILLMSDNEKSWFRFLLLLLGGGITLLTKGLRQSKI